MKHKIGDRIRIKSTEWYEKNRDENGVVRFSKKPFFTSYMAAYCGKISTIVSVEDGYYLLDVDFLCHKWCDEMFEEGEVIPSDDEEDEELQVVPLSIFQQHDSYYTTYVLNGCLGELRFLNHHPERFDKQEVIETLEEIIEYGKQTLEKLKK